MFDKTSVRSNRTAARLSAVSFASFGVAVLMTSLPVRADVTWTLPARQSGDWSSTVNWSGGTLPTTSDTAYIVNGGTANVTQLGETCGTLSLGSNAGSGAVQMTGGNLTSGDQYVGYSGTGTFTQSGGNNNITYYVDLADYSCALYLGSNAGSSGTYNLSGSGNVLAGYEYMGSYGMGTFTQTGGINYVGSILDLAPATGGIAMYNLSGSGQVSANNEEMAPFGGTATFAQSGGTNNTSLLWLLGAGSTYNFSGGQLLAFTEDLGNSGAATFTQTGGTNTVSNNLFLGDNAAGSATYNLSGSGLLLSAFSFGEYVGYSGTGTFTQSGGTNSMGTLQLGANAGSSGTYILSGSGQVSASIEFVGSSGTGTFTQSGGTNSVGYELSLGAGTGSGDTYSLSGSGQLLAAREYVGDMFQQTGGTNTVSLLSISNRGTYLLAGGTLRVNGGLLNQGIFAGSGSPAALSVSGILDLTSGTWQGLGAVSVSMGPNSLLIVPAGSNPSAGFANYSTLGLTHTLGTTLTVAAGQGFGGWGSISDPVNCQGTIIAAAGGAINLNGGLMLSDTGTVSLGAGNLTSNDSISGISSGSLSVASQYVGNGGTGTFAQSGGSNSFLNNLYLGYNAGDNGAYSLSGSSQLSSAYFASYEYVGYFGTGTFTQSGGTNRFSGPYTALCLGYNAGSSGTYILSGSGQVSAVYEEVGIGGTGTFTQSGGTNSIGVTLSLGSNGTYSLSGNGLLSAGYESVGSTGTFTQSGGTNIISNYLYFGYDAGSSGTYNFNGGLLVVAGLSPGSGSAAFNFNGGILQASGSFSTSVPMTLGSSGGGATFDTAGYIVTLSGSLSGAGSLTKVDSGTLILSGTDSYTGGTTVSEGTLILTNNEAIADGTSLTVGAGAMSIFAGAAAPQTAASASAVPEPGTLMLLGAGAIGLLGYAWRR